MERAIDRAHIEGSVFTNNNSNNNKVKFERTKFSLTAPYLLANLLVLTTPLDASTPPPHTYPRAPSNITQTPLLQGPPTLSKTNKKNKQEIKKNKLLCQASCQAFFSLVKRCVFLADCCFKKSLIGSSIIQV